VLSAAVPLAQTSSVGETIIVAQAMSPAQARTLAAQLLVAAHDVENN
jgi:hypothetical protein